MLVRLIRALAVRAAHEAWLGRVGDASLLAKQSNDGGQSMMGNTIQIAQVVTVAARGASARGVPLDARAPDPCRGVATAGAAARAAWRTTKHAEPNHDEA